MPTSAAAHELMTDELRKQTNKAAYTLLAIGILQLVCGMSVIGLLSQTGAAPRGEVQLLLVAQLVVAAIFIGLFFWARRSPLPASITGLVIYGTLLLINIVTTVSQFGAEERRGLGGLGIGWVDLIIIALLVQGIQAGLKHKKLTSGNA